MADDAQDARLRQHEAILTSLARMLERQDGINERLTLAIERIDYAITRIDRVLSRVDQTLVQTETTLARIETLLERQLRQGEPGSDR